MALGKRTDVFCCGVANSRLPEAAPPADTPQAGIRFEGVTFRYPGRDAAALARLDLVGPAGRSLAIVGANGAGKATLVKRLVRFDEPTAALDPQTEHALFERFAAAARSGASRGTVTLLISHRFSTVRMADRIVVLDWGRVLEVGSHVQLMAQHGLYAELYTLQAKAYG